MLTSARTTIRRAISHRAGAPAWWGGKRICKITCDLVPTNRRPELQLLIRVEVGNGPFAKLWELHTAHWRPHAHGAAPVPSRRVHPLSQSSGLIRPRQRGCLGRILMLASSGGDKADRRLKSYAPILCTSLTHVPMRVVDQWSPTKCLPPLHQRASKKSSGPLQLALRATSGCRLGATAQVLAITRCLRSNAYPGSRWKTPRSPSSRRRAGRSRGCRP